MTTVFPTTPTPTLAGFYVWVIGGGMGVDPAALPPLAADGNDPATYAYNTAVATVNLQLAQLPGPIYLQAVYNLAGDLLVNYAPDVPGLLWPNSTSPAYPQGTPYWTYLRNLYGCNAFQAGMVSSTSDEGTSVSIDIAESLKNLTLDQILNTKTPWGRRYLALAQKAGSLWGIS